jgi:c-di-GMP-binding flagellar brake protein YcgR
MDNDRRRFARTHAEHSCKVLHRASHRFYPGRTCDVSTNGAMVLLETARPLWPGEELSVYIAWNNEAGVVSQRLMAEARVVRVAGAAGERQVVALEFAEPVALAREAVTAA